MKRADLEKAVKENTETLARLSDLVSATLIGTHDSVKLLETRMSNVEHRMHQFNNVMQAYVFAMSTPLKCQACGAILASHVLPALDHPT